MIHLAALLVVLFLLGCFVLAIEDGSARRRAERASYRDTYWDAGNVRKRWEREKQAEESRRQEKSLCP
jgi:hypothetical protein